jgi:hypothetical protein
MSASVVIFCSTWIATTFSACCAVAIYDSFDPGGSFNPQYYLDAANVSSVDFQPLGAVALRAAARFMVTGNDYYLSSITLPISVQQSGTTTNVLRVRLTTDDGGMPGTTLEVLSQNQGIWPVFANPFTNKTTLVSATWPHLFQGSNYWIVTEPTAFPTNSRSIVQYRWSYNTNGLQMPIRQQQATGSLPTDPWSGVYSSDPLALRVEGVPVPSLSIQVSPVTLCWDSFSNQIYQVQYTTNLNLIEWQNLGSPVLGNDSQICITNGIPEEPQRFYRLAMPMP